ncbi:MAG: Peptidase domain protein [Methanosaeta sp. NSP1]|nr:MAG: Peptidase domain protein [Methanosaeta sp. NSP1]
MAKALFLFALASMALFSLAIGQNADSFEPNNEIGDADELGVGQMVNASISPAQDYDCYKIHLDSPGVLSAQLSAIPDEMKGRIDFYGKNFNWITRKDAENPGENVILTVDIGKAGWYYFGIGDLNGGSYKSDYSFSVSFEPIIDEEPNGEIGDAVEIKPGEIIRAYVFPAQDWDVYKIFLNSTGVLQASLADVPRSITGSMKGRIDLYGKNMNWITRSDAANPGDDVALTVDIGYPGWYYLGVGDLNSGSYNMTYSFGTAFKPVVDLEPNNEIGDAVEIKMGSEIKGYIFPASDYDVYKVYIGARSIQASLYSVPKSTQASMKGRIDLYGKNYNWITRADAEKPGDDVLLKAELPNAGWYYFGIGDLNGGSYDEEYALKVA